MLDPTNISSKTQSKYLAPCPLPCWTQDSFSFVPTQSTTLFVAKSQNAKNVQCLQIPKFYICAYTTEKLHIHVIHCFTQPYYL